MLFWSDIRKSNTAFKNILSIKFFEISLQKGSVSASAHSRIATWRAGNSRFDHATTWMINGSV